MPTDTGPEPLIVKVIQSYYPDWKPPKDTGREWYSCLCPFHGESRPSASVSYENDAFACHACGEKGDALAILMRKEAIGYLEAVKAAEGLSPGSSQKIQKHDARKSSRRVFGEGPGARPAEHRVVRPGVRSRPRPWS